MSESTAFTTVVRWGTAVLVVLVLAAFITFMFMSFENTAVNNNKLTNSFVKVNNALTKEINHDLSDDHG